MDELEKQPNLPPSPSESIPHYREFVGGLIEAFGGARAFAEAYHEAYEATKPGSPSRVQLVINMGKMILANTKEFGEKTPTEEMSDEELAAVLSKALEGHDRG